MIGTDFESGIACDRGAGASWRLIAGMLKDAGTLGVGRPDERRFALEARADGRNGLGGGFVIVWGGFMLRAES